MKNNEKEIINELNYYISNNNANYSILLNGEWGCGKTYFIKNYINNIKENSDKRVILYISLYGLSSKNDINEAILNYFLLHKNGKIISNVFAGTIGLISNIMGLDIDSEKAQNSTESLIDKIGNYQEKLNNAIIIFDDLERCTIDINETLGFINGLVEHNNVKAIIVANEKELNRINYEKNLELKYLVALSKNVKIDNTNQQDDFLSEYTEKTENDSDNISVDLLNKRTKQLFNNNIYYNNIKEKVIGKTLTYLPNIESIYKCFVNQYGFDEETKEVLYSLQKYVNDLLTRKEHTNLRTLGNALEIFDRLVKESNVFIKSNHNSRKQYLKDLFKYCLIQEVNMKSDNAIGDYLGSQLIAYKAIDEEELENIYCFKIVDDYIKDSYTNKDDIRETISQYKNLIQQVNDDNIDTIERWWKTPQSELERTIDNIYKKIKNNKYNLELYQKIAFALVRIQMMQIKEDKIDKILQCMIDNLLNNEVKGNYVDDDCYIEDENTRLMIKNKLEPLYNAIIKHNELIKKEKIEEILNNKKWGTEFNNYCKTNISMIKEKEKFLAYMDNNKKIYNSLSKKAIGEGYQFYHAIRHIYDSKIDIKWDNEEIVYLKDLQNRILKSKAQDKVRTTLMIIINDYIEQVIKNIETKNNLPNEE